MTFEEAIKVTRRASLLQLWAHSYPRYILGNWVVCLVSNDHEFKDVAEGDGWVRVTRTPIRMVESREELETVAREYYVKSEKLNIKARQ